MASIEDYVKDRSALSPIQIHRLRELIADWQLLSDLSFADLILWVPLRKDFKSWPTGYVAVAHIRPTTSATLFPHDVIGEEISYGSRPHIDQALAGAEIIRDTQPEQIGDHLVKEETIPVILDETVIAVVLFNMLIKSTSALFASSITYCVPIVAAAWGFLDGEQIGTRHLVGILFILLGVYLVNAKKEVRFFRAFRVR